MCRFLVYKGRDARFKIRLSDLIVTPVHSIIHQSFDSRERLTEGVVPAQLNADGDAAACDHCSLLCLEFCCMLTYIA